MVEFPGLPGIVAETDQKASILVFAAIRERNSPSEPGGINDMIPGRADAAGKAGSKSNLVHALAWWVTMPPSGSVTVTSAAILVMGRLDLLWTSARSSDGYQ